MLYTNIIIIALILFLFIKANGYSKDWLIDIDKKKHSLYFFYPMTRLLLENTGLEKRLTRNVDLNEKIRALNITGNQERHRKFYWYQKISLIILCALLLSSFTLIILIQEKVDNTSSFDNHLIRPEDGQGDEVFKLEFRLENENDRDDYYEDEILIKNYERVYTDKQFKEVLDKAIPYIEEKMLGANKDAEHVDKDLNFISHIPETSITVEWIPKEYLLIASDGKINNRDMDSEKEDTLVTAVLKYQDKKVEHTIPITILPAELEGEEELYKDLEEILDTRAHSSRMSREWSLPKEIGKYSIKWERPKSNRATIIFITGIFTVILLWFYKDKELKDMMKQRNDQMLLDYPEIINKFNLLVNAEMTIKQAWTKISEDYKYTVDNNKGTIRYAYEEMLLTLHELRLGIPEVIAYEQFGKRVGLIPFMKLSSMLVQNLKKGNKDLVNMLGREAMEAFQERKETAKRLGEEASTKLLGPMLIMLIIVLIIIMVPAFMSFSI